MKYQEGTKCSIWFPPRASSVIRVHILECLGGFEKLIVSMTDVGKCQFTRLIEVQIFLFIGHRSPIWSSISLFFRTVREHFPFRSMPVRGHRVSRRCLWTLNEDNNTTTSRRFVAKTLDARRTYSWTSILVQSSQTLSLTSFSLMKRIIPSFLWFSIMPRFFSTPRALHEWLYISNIFIYNYKIFSGEKITEIIRNNQRIIFHSLLVYFSESKEESAIETVISCPYYIIIRLTVPEVSFYNIQLLKNSYKYNIDIRTSETSLKHLFTDWFCSHHKR